MGPHQTLVVCSAEADTSAIREETYMGRKYLAVPVIALVEGVLTPANAGRSELALAAEFGKVPASWNGRPVVMNHPKNVDGEPISAGDPGVLESYGMGLIFNTRLEDKKLHQEAWFDVERINELGGELQESLQRIQAGEMVEISTGLFTNAVEQTGVWQSGGSGEVYDAIWRDVVPDHLAILSKGLTGACSVEAGCGTPRTNEGKPSMMKTVAGAISRVLGTSTPASTSAAVPSTHESSCDCPDKAKCSCVPVVNAQQKERLRTLAEAIQVDELVPAYQFLANQYPNGMVDRDVRQLLTQKLQAEYGPYCWLAYFNQSSCIYELVNLETYTCTYWQMDYTIDNSTKVTFTSAPVQVNVLTRIEPVQLEGGSDVTRQNNSGAESTTQTPNPDPNISPDPNKGKVPGSTTEETTEETTTTETTETPEKPAGIGPTDNQHGSSARSTSHLAPQAPKFNNMQEYLQSVPPEMREQIEAGQRILQQQRGVIINALKSTNRCDYSDEELNKMPLKDLERLAKLSSVQTYEGAGAPRQNAAGDNDAPPAPPLVFERAAAKAA